MTHLNYGSRPRKHTITADRLSGDRKGNVIVFVAFSMMLIIFCVALAVDLGFLTMQKDDLQNKVEAAVETGVRVLYKGSYTEPVMQCHNSFLANGENINPLYLLYYFYHPGYYDYKDVYADFPHFKNFASAKYGEVPEGENENAIAIIDLKKNVDAMEITHAGQNSGRIGAAAVAYGINYTFLALEDGPEAMKWYRWEPDFNKYRNCLVASNGGIVFNGTETFDSMTRIEASGSVSTLNGDPPPAYNQVGKVTLPDINWDQLRQDAENNGKVYDPETWTEEWQNDEYGNHYKRSEKNGYRYYWFIPAGKDLTDTSSTGGDHNGRSYFIDVPYPMPMHLTDMTLHIMNTAHEPSQRVFWNATIAARCNMSTFPNPAYGPYKAIQFGDYENLGNDGLVYLYSQKFYRWYTRYDMLPVSIPKGVIVRCEDKFTMYSQYRYTYTGYPEEFYLKVIAGSMYLYGMYHQAIVFHGNFGPPDVFRLGLL